MRLSTPLAALVLASGRTVAASSCKPSTAPAACGTNLIGSDADFAINGDKWHIQTDPLSTYLVGTCDPFSRDSCISYDFHAATDDATGSLAFTYALATPQTSSRYRFWFYYRRTQDNAVAGTIGCSVDGAQSQYDDGLVYQQPNLWSTFAANVQPTGPVTTVRCSLEPGGPVTYDLTNFGYQYYCDGGPSQQR